MYSDIPFWLSLVLMLGGLAVLAWSSDVFVDGAAAAAKALGISPFIIGAVSTSSSSETSSARISSTRLPSWDLRP